MEVSNVIRGVKQGRGNGNGRKGLTSFLALASLTILSSIVPRLDIYQQESIHVTGATARARTKNEERSRKRGGSNKSKKERKKRTYAINR
jgi:hypothetical protein